MNHIPRIVVQCIFTAILLAGCGPLSSSPYFISTERTPESTKTSVIDSETDTTLVEIAEYSDELPNVRVFYPERPDSASPTAAGAVRDIVQIEHSESENGNNHAVGFENPAQPMPLSLVNLDNNQDGIADGRIVALPMGTGFTHYFDLDANGVLDAYAQVDRSGVESKSRRAILVDQQWIGVDDESAIFQQNPLRATTVTPPNVTYEFRGGIWQAPESASQD